MSPTGTLPISVADVGTVAPCCGAWGQLKQDWLHKIQIHLNYGQLAPSASQRYNYRQKVLGCAGLVPHLKTLQKWWQQPAAAITGI